MAVNQLNSSFDKFVSIFNVQEGISGGSSFVGDENEFSKSFISNSFPFTNIFSGTGESV